MELTHACLDLGTVLIGHIFKVSAGDFSASLCLYPNIITG